MNTSNYELYEPTNDEARRIYERIKFWQRCLVKGFGDDQQVANKLRGEMVDNYRWYWSAIAKDQVLWKKRNPHLFQDELEELEPITIPRNVPSPEKCHYFKYININYQKIARNSPDPTKYSMEYGNPEVMFNSYHALPGDLRRSERDLETYFSYSIIPKPFRPSREEMRAWIKGKAIDNQKCIDVIKDYIMVFADKCVVRGLDGEDVVPIEEDFQKLSH